MEPRLDFWKTEPQLMGAVRALNDAAVNAGLEKSLVHLVKLRASQINSCAYCVDMHSREARKDGESEQRLHLLAVWHESPLYTDRERAALAWTERLTRLSDGPVDDALYEAALGQFSPSELVKLSVLVAAINVWNRLCVPFRSVHPVVATREPAAA
ncbi:carboxymuconolactone decarboxylase family protein [Nitratireductor sp. ZSWI3]|uniref:carboxymuconolactone decarboxylase family protein n=1 Tax=Nitratireductor sp. ZSWI3 TaxID=2966359 RepID=UPI00214FD663|nr:carboxymuconolactone decarboxylase family protein [Nitratireductor sp. ZSWI3]MCR4268207.1 carboxymuconolactone decarboxylase family protein [Nitratireductor sp. ZSWI3]